MSLEAWFTKVTSAFLSWNLVQWHRLFSYDHAISFFSMGSGLIVALLFIAFSRTPWNRLKRKMKAHLSANRSRKEFSLDVKFFALRWLHFPLSTALLGGAALYSHQEISVYVYGKLGPFLSWRPLALDDIKGPAILSMYTALCLDFSVYLAHRISHSVPWFWHFHKVHHRARYLNPLTKYRVHPMGELIEASLHAFFVGILIAAFSLVFWVPQSGPVVVGAGIFAISHWLTLHLNHSHCPLSFGPWLERVFLSPVLHQIHHGRSAKYHDKNFGTVFAFWDRIFGTFYAPAKGERWAIGLEEEYSPMSLGLKAELVKPFAEIGRSLISHRGPNREHEQTHQPSSGNQRIPNRHAGFTLVELLIAAGVGSILVLVASTILVESVRTNLKLSDKIDAAASLEQGLIRIATYTQLGIEVRPTALVPPNAPPVATGVGYIRQNFVYNQFNDMNMAPGAQTWLMYFSRENRFLPKVISGRPPTSATAVYFRAPAPNRMGAIIIDSGSGIGTETLSIDASDFVIDNVVGVSLANASSKLVNGITLMERIELSVTVRSFIISGGKARATLIGCPRANINQCPGLEFKDTTRTIVLNFANNRRLDWVNSSRPMFEFAHGFYLFRTQVLN